MSTGIFASTRMGFALVWSGFLLGGCASTRIEIDSFPPQATVRAKPLGSGGEQDLGQTPLKLSSEDLEKTFNGSGPVVLEFVRDGYRSEKILISELGAIDLRIKADLKPLSGLEDPNVINATIEKLFEVQRLVRLNRLDEGLVIVRELKKDAPYIASVFELEGGILYLKREFRASLDAYRIAVKINPRSVEAARMREMLEKQLLPADALRLPAQSSPAPAPQDLSAPAAEPVAAPAVNPEPTPAGGTN